MICPHCGYKIKSIEQCACCPPCWNEMCPSCYKKINPIPLDCQLDNELPKRFKCFKQNDGPYPKVCPERNDK